MAAERLLTKDLDVGLVKRNSITLLQLPNQYVHFLLYTQPAMQGRVLF